MLRVWVYCCCLALMLMSQAVFSKPESKLIQVRCEDWISYSEAGDGFLFKMLKAVYEPLGYQLKFKFCPWKRCLQDVIEARADIMVSLYGNEAFVGETIMVNQQAVYVERIGVAYKHSLWPDWQGENTLQGRTLGMIRGYDLDDELSVPVKVVEVTTAEQLWRLLAADRIDFIIDGIMPLSQGKGREGMSFEPFTVSHLFNKKTYFGFTHNARGRQLADIMDERYLELYQAGVIDKLQKQHGVDWMMGMEPKVIAEPK